jgi:sugar phosphate isomerase/epimerase
MGRLAINELTTFRWSLEEDIENYAAFGIGAIGVWRQKLADCGENKGAELLAEAGLTVSSLQWAGGFTGSCGPSHDENLDDARAAIRLAAQLQAGCLIIHSGARGIHTHNHARRLFRQALDKLLPVAEDWGVTLAVEPMRGDCGGEWTFLNCLNETFDLVVGYNSGSLQIALDTYHWAHEPALLVACRHLCRGWPLCNSAMPASRRRASKTAASLGGAFSRSGRLSLVWRVLAIMAFTKSS